ncbi:MAG TPA: hypothetical protein PKC76_03355 [Saprospiraceae bacterium]|nr:hypothetical protein [Saprospiraceae bacterium]HMP23141.1 hypothetical protein [Saprospiraceae bacterium]
MNNVDTRIARLWFGLRNNLSWRPAPNVRLSSRTVFRFVQIATIAVFVGRAWQHLYWDAPYRALLWDENWLRPLVEGVLGGDWGVYVRTSEQGIERWIRGTGILYLLCALAAAVGAQRWRKPVVALLAIGAANLLLLAALYYKEHFWQAGQLIEYTLQWGSPVFLILLLQTKPPVEQLIRWMRIATALTFVGHGLYAFGYYPRPVLFVEMTMSILQVSDVGAAGFLQIVGILDFVAALLLFVPGKLGRVALLYCVIWGFLTSVARLWAHFHPAFLDNLLLQWLHEAVMRSPHFLIPAAIWYAQRAATVSPEELDAG